MRSITAPRNKAGLARIASSQQSGVAGTGVMHGSRDAGKNIACLGLSFKPGTDGLRESPQVQPVKRPFGEGCEVEIWDEMSASGRRRHQSRMHRAGRSPHRLAPLSESESSRRECRSHHHCDPRFETSSTACTPPRADHHRSGERRKRKPGQGGGTGYQRGMHSIPSHVDGLSEGPANRCHRLNPTCGKSDRITLSPLSSTIPLSRTNFSGISNAHRTDLGTHGIPPAAINRCQ